MREREKTHKEMVTRTKEQDRINSRDAEQQRQRQPINTKYTHITVNKRNNQKNKMFKIKETTSRINQKMFETRR